MAKAWNCVPLHTIERNEYRSPAASVVSSTSASTSYTSLEPLQNAVAVDALLHRTLLLRDARAACRLPHALIAFTAFGL